jgi:hypothetical protein
LVLRIGVTGHRQNRFPEDGQRVVAEKLVALFARISAAAKALHASEVKVFDFSPPEIRIVSALAEGADRIVAQAGLNAGFALDVVLPFTPEDYAADFSEAASKAAFRTLLAKARACFTLPGARSADDPSVANRAYEAAGLMTLRQCDLLITVWDGKEAAGRGGTEGIVQHAIDSGRPVLRFDEHGNGPFLLETSIGSPTDTRDLAAEAAKNPAADKETITRIVERLCAPPGAEANYKDNARIRLQQLLRERQKRFTWGAFFYPLLLSLLSKKRQFWQSIILPRYSAGVAGQWQTYWAALGEGCECVEPIRHTVMERFTWADGLANYYSQLHRSGYIGNYIFAASAVFCAALSVMGAGGEWSLFGELGAIAIIALTTYYGKFRRWHVRWLDYRQLSAQLRHLRALALVGSTSFETHHVHSGGGGKPASAWINWYCRMTAREIGVLNCTADAAYTAKASGAISRGEIKDQIDYHRTNAERMHSVEDKLDRIGFWSFFLPFIICAVEFLSSIALPGWLTILTVVLPALGAGMFGIRVHGDFQGSAERSADMAAQLQNVLDRLDSPEEKSFSELSALTEHAVMLMASEIGDWTFVYRGRPLALPA